MYEELKKFRELREQEELKKKKTDLGSDFTEQKRLDELLKSTGSSKRQTFEARGREAERIGRKNLKQLRTEDLLQSIRDK